MIDNTPPLCERYKNVIATEPLVKHPPNGWISGCLYDSTGRAIRLSQRFGGYHGDFYPNADPARIATSDFADLTVLKGRSLYLGHYMPHYGHFLVEMLSTFWLYQEFSFFDHFLFHPFVFGESMPSYLADAFHLFNVPIHKVLIIKSKMIIQDVTIPERLIRLNMSAKAEARRVYQYLADAMPKPKARPIAKQFYLSRVRISLTTGQRAILNEPIIESMLRRMGFITVYPELLSLRDQISLFHRANIVCGLSGSALHNCVFMGRDSLLIEVGDPRSNDTTHPMQLICNRLSSVTYRFIPFSGKILNNNKQLGLIECSKVIPEIEDLLRQYLLEQRLAPTVRSRPIPVSLRNYCNNMLMISVNILRLFKWWLIDGRPNL
mgnify:CR=1 FL=1